MDIVSKAAEKQEELIKRTEIADSPFTVIETEGKVFGTMGQYRLTEQFDSFEEAMEETRLFTWNRVVQVMMLLVDKLKAVDLEELINNKEK